MQPYRQKKSAMGGEHLEAKTRVTAPLSNRKPKPAQNGKLRELTNQNHQAKSFKLICRGQVSIDCELVKEAARNRGSRRTTRSIHLQASTPQALRHSLQQWTLDPRQEFVFAAQNYKDDPKMSKNTEVSKSSALYKTEPHKSNHPNTNQIPSTTDKALFARVLSNKNIADGFLTVPEPKQTERKSKEKDHGQREKENLIGIPNLSQINFRNPSDTQQYLKQIRTQSQGKNQRHEDQPQKDELFTQERMPVKQDQDLRRDPVHPNTLPQQAFENEKGQRTVVEQSSRFSFASHLRQGLIDVGTTSLQPQLSFKIAGDSQIEHQKRRGQDCLGVQENSRMSQLSSIISNAREEGRKEADESIKNELDNISHYASVKQEESTQKVEIKVREAQQGDGIHISETTTADKCYTVHYDVRFLKQKCRDPTEVVRLSPLRFRKRQQVPLQTRTREVLTNIP